MYVEACLLWSLIDLRSFRCPYHEKELRPQAASRKEPKIAS